MINIQELVDNPQTFQQIKETDIDDIAKEVYPFIQNRIRERSEFFSKELFIENDDLSKSVFELKAKDAVRNAIYTYLANERWKFGVPIVPYLAKTIYMFTKVLVNEYTYNANKITVYVCPACKERKIMEILGRGEDLFYCVNCENELKNSELSDDQRILHSAFASHSIRGVKCPQCGKFVPNSMKTNENFFCPYVECHADCSSAEDMKHPISFVNRNFVSMNTPIKPGSPNIELDPYRIKEFSEKYCDGGNNACEILSKEEELVNKYNIIRDIIELQKKINGYTRKIPVKVSMYDAFLSILEKYPEEMINYIVHGGQAGGDISIQATIYQEFAKLLRERLPIKVYSKGDMVFIDNPLDERLHLFNGIREFVNFIDHNSLVKRKPQMKYINDEKIEDNENCFIGQIIDVRDMDGNDLVPYVESYNFTSIKFKYCEQIAQGSDVLIKYYSILPSYTLGSMIHLQRIKKKISDSVGKKVE